MSVWEGRGRGCRASLQGTVVGAKVRGDGEKLSSFTRPGSRGRLSLHDSLGGLVFLHNPGRPRELTEVVGWPNITAFEGLVFS